MYCPRCGKDAGSSRFCPECGQVIDGPVALPQGTAGGCVKVNKIAYAMLAIFLGSLGIHRFYAKRPISGIAYLLMPVLGIVFMWLLFPMILIFIPGILGFIEGIIALVEDDDGHGNLIVQEGKYLV